MGKARPDVDYPPESTTTTTAAAAPTGTVPHRVPRLLHHSNYFSDKLRRVDFILTYTIVEGLDDNKRSAKVLYRQKFEDALRACGLELEYEGPDEQGLVVVKVHASFETLAAQAQYERLHLPVMLNDLAARRKPGCLRRVLGLARLSRFVALPEDCRVEERFDYFLDAYSIDEHEIFLWHKDRPAFFHSAQRVYLAWQIISNIQFKMQFNADNPPIMEERPLGCWAKLLFKLHRKPLPPSNIVHAPTAEHDVNVVYLLQKNVYSTAQPLHDGHLASDTIIKDAQLSDRHGALPSKKWPLRECLYDCWARWRNWHTYQPLDQIREYYGEKVALYYAWLGFYTYRLVLPSVVGVLLLVWGIVYASMDDYVSWLCREHSTEELLLQTAQYGAAVGAGPLHHGYQWMVIRLLQLDIQQLQSLQQFSELGVNGSVFQPIAVNNHSSELSALPALLCRECAAPFCTFQKMQETCTSAFLQRVVESPAQLFFSMFIAIWAICFLEGWKNYQDELVTRWGTPFMNSKQKKMRPEYSLLVKSSRQDPVTGQQEPYVPKRSLRQRLLASISTIIFFICLVVALMVGVMVYRRVGPAFWKLAHSRLDENGNWVYDTSWGDPILVTNIISSLMNGVCIAIMGFIYQRICARLTEWELCRTEEDYEYSYTYKLAIFQSVNFYGALFYLVFMRGVVTPDPKTIQAEVWERCPLPGCLLQVTVQLVIIMTGKQLFNNIMELGLPLLLNCWRRRRAKLQLTAETPLWQADQQLQPVPPFSVLSDYMEMFIQYGFVTLFAAAFPLAPLFALINNVIEIRLDAIKMLTQMRRPIPVPVVDIGPWLPLLKTITKVGVFTNAFLIAITSNVINIGMFRYFASDSIVTDSAVVGHDDVMPWMLTPFNTSLWCGADNDFDPQDPQNRTCHQLMYSDDPFTVNDTRVLINRLHFFAASLPDEQLSSMNHWFTDDSADFANFTEGQYEQIKLYNTLLTTHDYSHAFVHQWLRAADDAEILSVRISQPLFLLAHERGLDLQLPGTRFAPVCFIRDFRNPQRNYVHDHRFHHMLWSKLLFILLFEHLVFILQALLQWLMPRSEYVLLRRLRQAFVQRMWLERRTAQLPASSMAHNQEARLIERELQEIILQLDPEQSMAGRSLKSFKSRLSRLSARLSQKQQQRPPVLNALPPDDDVTLASGAMPPHAFVEDDEYEEAEEDSQTGGARARRTRRAGCGACFRMLTARAATAELGYDKKYAAPEQQ